ncbi:MAG: YceI family protein [Actinobacteria bacterium]|nr:YceI family protein [Actinomycetota bacterium]MBO0818100.1 YceI family protein [Actinomycetota bacterium]
MSSPRRRRWLWWVTGAAAIVVVLAVGGPFVYIHFIEGGAAAPLSLGTGAGASTEPAEQAASGPVAGTWRVAAGSQAGYRVKEVLLGQDNIAIGRTRSVTGTLTITGTTVTTGAFTVRMDTIRSDRSQRDAQFDGRIMDVASYPTGTFRLTRPIRLAPVPAPGAVHRYQATGSLTLHGHARTVTFGLSAERTGAGIEVSGTIPVRFATWDIPNPSFGSFVTTQDHGELEFLLKLSRS